jgi:hypothetical protein
VPATVDLAEVDRQAIVFKHQIEQAAGGAIPFLALPEAPNVGFGHCGSCGVVLSPPATHRCRTCRAAVLWPSAFQLLGLVNDHPEHVVSPWRPPVACLVDHYVWERVRHFLRRRHKSPREVPACPGFAVCVVAGALATPNDTRTSPRLPGPDPIRKFYVSTPWRLRGLLSII